MAEFTFRRHRLTPRSRPRTRPPRDCKRRIRHARGLVVVSQDLRGVTWRRRRVMRKQWDPSNRGIDFSQACNVRHIRGSGEGWWWRGRCWKQRDNLCALRIHYTRGRQYCSFTNIHYIHECTHTSFSLDMLQGKS